jgi:hypothetical protein
VAVVVTVIDYDYDYDYDYGDDYGHERERDHGRNAILSHALSRCGARRANLTLDA